MFTKKPDGPYDCHETGFRERCRKERCPKWVSVALTDQKGKTIDSWDCADRWQPVLTIHLSRQLSELVAAVNNMRNEGRKDASIFGAAMLAAAEIAAGFGADGARRGAIEAGQRRVLEHKGG